MNELKNEMRKYRPQFQEVWGNEIKNTDEAEILNGEYLAEIKDVQIIHSTKDNRIFVKWEIFINVGPDLIRHNIWDELSSEKIKFMFWKLKALGYYPKNENEIIDILEKKEFKDQQINISYKTNYSTKTEKTYPNVTFLFPKKEKKEIDNPENISDFTNEIKKDGKEIEKPYDEPVLASEELPF
jgi:hypothetical protein